MQYFIGYTCISHEEPFDPSLIVDIRKRLSLEHINEINEKILGLIGSEVEKKKQDGQTSNEKDQPIANPELPCNKDEPAAEQPEIDNEKQPDVKPKAGSLLMDATVCPQDIAYPTDLNILNDAREKSEELFDILHSGQSIDKPRTYREVARKQYLSTAQKKKKTKREIITAVRRQLQYLKLNIKSIHQLLSYYDRIPSNQQQYKYMLVIPTLLAVAAYTDCIAAAVECG